MKKFEIVLGCIILFGVLLRIIDFPGSRILTVMPLSFLAWFYFLFSFFLFNGKRLKDMFKKETYTSTGVYKTFVSIFIGWWLSGFVAGIMFFVVDFLGKWTYFFTSSVLLIISMLVLPFGINAHRHFVINCLKRVIIVVVFGSVAAIIL